jgi:REP element-mobilizing transposase RayT
MGNFRVPFLPDTNYHVFNHGNGDELIFKRPDNYRYFLEKVSVYVLPVAKVFAYCLMPNHFHLSVRIRSGPQLFEFFRSKKLHKLIRQYGKALPEDSAQLIRIGENDLPDLIARQFGDFLNGYTQAFNREQHRKGSLFLDNIQRKIITHDAYWLELIRYIHANPVHHRFCQHVTDWKYSSYAAFLSDKPTQLERREVLEGFGNRDEFIRYHQRPINPDFRSDFD